MNESPKRIGSGRVATAQSTKEVPGTAKGIPVVDYHLAPVQVVNHVTIAGSTNDQITLICKTLDHVIEEVGKYRAQYVIAAKLRVNFEMARILRDKLDAVLAMQKPASGRTN